MKQPDELITRTQLAQRWNCSVRTIDRMRSYGRIPWIDLSGGIGLRPSIRFLLTAIEHYEIKHLKSICLTPTT